MTMPCDFRPPAVLQSRKQRGTSVSVSLCCRSCGFRTSSSVGGQCTTWLTWTYGLTNISGEGGPERKHNGP